MFRVIFKGESYQGKLKLPKSELIRHLSEYPSRDQGFGFKRKHFFSVTPIETGLILNSNIELKRMGTVTSHARPEATLTFLEEDVVQADHHTSFFWKAYFSWGLFVFLSFAMLLLLFSPLMLLPRALAIAPIVILIFHIFMVKGFLIKRIDETNAILDEYIDDLDICKD